MPDQLLLDPVSEDDPCGSDLRWDPEFAALEHAFEMATADVPDVVEGEPEEAQNTYLDEAIAAARRLCATTKDLRVLAMLAEATWRQRGLVAFADTLSDLVTVAETWADPDAGFHPRADEEDGDLGERNAPLAKLVGRIPVLVETVAWGTAPSPAEQTGAREALASVFDAWTTRLEPAFGSELATPRDAWSALRRLVGEGGGPQGEEPGEAPAGQAIAAAGPAVTDAWDALEHTLQLMTLQNAHSPAIPVLRLLATWRDADIIAIAEAMSEAGVTLEQLLEAIKKRLDAA